MATCLYLITNSKLSGDETEKDWDRIVKELTNLNMETTSVLNADNVIVKEYGDWNYEIESDEDFPFNVYFDGPYHMHPNLYSNIGVICTFYKYRHLYEIYGFDSFASFRNDLFNIVKIMGGTEVIYLADNSCNKLSNYLELMALENVPYEEIKEKMILEFGDPISDYSKLNFDKLTYNKINEFFLDNFEDLKK